MTADIIEFGAYQPGKTLRPRPRPVVCEADDTPRKTAGTTTGKNESLRAARRDAWFEADALTRYWRTLLDFDLAISIAKRCGLKEVHGQIEIDQSSALASWHEAFGKQLLTPAPDVAAVNWKRRKMRKACYVEKEDIEESIADDSAFLDAHPTRQVRKGKVRP